MPLRGYQSDALAAVSNLRDRGARRMIVAVPTGGGKTIIFAHLAESLGLRPTDKILILAHRDELVQQAVDKYLAVNPGEMIGIEKGSARAGGMDRVCVASVQTLHEGRIADFLARFGRPALVVTDEAHHAVAPRYNAIYEALNISSTGSVIHVGVTATPKRADKIGLDGTFDCVAYSIGIGELVKLGFLVPLVGYRVRTRTNLDDVRTVGGEFVQGDLADAVDNPQRNAAVVQAYVDVTPGRKALVFAASVAHSKNLAQTFARAGYRSGHVDGEMKLADRRAVLQAFHDGKVDVLCNCAVLTEGYDEPSIEVVMIARPTKSTVMYAQMVGRGTRLAEGKSKAAVIDMVDATRKHSVVSLPSLLGLPPSFNLGGRNAIALADRWQAMAERDPALAGMVNDAATLLAVDNGATEQQMAIFTKRLLDEAARSNHYIPVDLFRPPAMPPETDDFARMVWVPQGNDTYRLRLKNSTLFIEGDVTNRYRVSVHAERRAPQDLGTYHGQRAAFEAAENWVRVGRGENLNFLDKRVGWRRKTATPKQRAILKKYRIECPAEMSAGDAADAIDRIMEGLARGTIHAPKKRHG